MSSKTRIIDGSVLLLLCIVQQQLVSAMTLFGALPDVVTVFIAFLAIRYGQIQGTTYGFVAGLVTGILGGNAGIETLSRTIEGFVAGYFHIPGDSPASRERKKKIFYKGVFLACLVGRLPVVLSANALFPPSIPQTFLTIGLATLFTMIVAIFAYHLFFYRNL